MSMFTKIPPKRSAYLQLILHVKPRKEREIKDKAINSAWDTSEQDHDTPARSEVRLGSSKEDCYYFLDCNQLLYYSINIINSE